MHICINVNYVIITKDFAIQLEKLSIYALFLAKSMSKSYVSVHQLAFTNDLLPGASVLYVLVQCLCGYKETHGGLNNNTGDGDKNEIQSYGSDEEVSVQIPTQAQSLVEGSGAVLVSEYKPPTDVDYLQVC